MSNMTISKDLADSLLSGIKPEYIIDGYLHFDNVAILKDRVELRKNNVLLCILNINSSVDLSKGDSIIFNTSEGNMKLSLT